MPRVIDSSTHWPGPWRLESSRREARHVVVAGSDVFNFWFVANVEPGIQQEGVDFTRANALLIAAAPELLEAATMAREMLGSPGGWGPEQERRVLAALAAAVEKAKGVTALDVDRPSYAVEGEGGEFE